MLGRTPLVVVSAVILFSCSSSPTSPDTPPADGGSMVPTACETYVSTAVLTSPTVSLARDVTPIFLQSCSFSSCHGTAANGGLQLAVDAATALSPQVLHDNLIAKSEDLPTMPIVTPGNPSTSFLMHKLDGDQCRFDMQCSGVSCGEQMPQDNAALPVATRDVLRRWIAQGASVN